METLPFSLKDYPFDKANALTLASAAPRNRPHRLLRLGLFAALGALVGVTVGSLHQPVWVMISVAANFLAVIHLVAQRLGAKKALSGMCKLPSFAGHPRIFLTDAGLRMCGQDGESLTRWSGLRDVILGPEGWIIVSAGPGYIPLPAAAFASPAEAEAFITALRARIPVVKEPF